MTKNVASNHKERAEIFRKKGLENLGTHKVHQKQEKRKKTVSKLLGCHT